MNRKVLVVDDDHQVRELMGFVVASTLEGVELVLAENGEEGMQKFLDHAPFLIISDIRMPIMSGTDMLRRIREVSQVPVVLLSGYCSDNELAVAHEANYFIQKPFSATNFMKVLISAVGGANQQ